MKTLANSVYIAGISILFVLTGLVLFGAGFVPNPGAMAPWNLREIAFVGLAAGTLPMGFACMAVVRWGSLKHTGHKKRHTLLVFLPCFLCGACLVTVLGVFAVMLVQAIGYTMP